MILFYADDVFKPKFPIRVIKNWIKAIIVKQNRKIGDINFIFCSDEKILELNKQFLNHNYFTDIITFNNCLDSVIAGDIYISIDTVLDNSKKYKVEYTNELHRVIIHGILHLLGFNDKTLKEKKIMTNQENICLELLYKNLI